MFLAWVILVLRTPEICCVRKPYKKKSIVVETHDLGGEFVSSPHDMTMPSNSFCRVNAILHDLFSTQIIQSKSKAVFDNLALDVMAWLTAF